MSRYIGILDTVTQWLIVLVFALTPLFFLPITADFYDTNKWMLLVVSSLVVLVLWAIRTALSQEVTVTLSPSVAGLAGLVVAALLSLVFASANKVEALLSPFGLVTFSSLLLIFLLGRVAPMSRAKMYLTRLLPLAGGLVSLVAIYEFFGLGKIVFSRIPFLADPLWTPIGSSAGLIMFLLLVLPLILNEFFMALRKKDDINIGVSAVTGSLILVGLVLTIIKFAPTVSQTVLPIQDGWAIALEVLKNPKRAFVGAGAENFIAAFTLGRPLTMNASSLWNTRFNVNASLFLHIMSTLGLLGGAAFVVFLSSLLSPIRLGLATSGYERRLAGLYTSLIFGLLALALLPPSFTILVTVGALLLLTGADAPVTRLSWRIPSSVNWLGVGIALVIGLLVIASLATIGRTYQGELVYYQSLQALAQNKGTDTYNLQIKANTINPWITQFHLNFSQTNLALANAMAAQASAPRDGTAATVSEADRQTISSLIQQAIREAKITVDRAPENILAWENLARTYQALTGVAQGADQWAIASYQRAIELDPTNPALRVSLGGLYQQQGDLEGAVGQFVLAVGLKPDWANAHYNLANAYRARKDILKTARELQLTLNNLPSTATADRDRVSAELDQTKKTMKPEELAVFEGRPQVSGATSNQPSLLTRPDETNPPLIQPKLELPEVSSPPAVPTSSIESSPTPLQLK